MQKIILIVIAMLVEQLSAGQLKNTSGIGIEAKFECSPQNFTNLKEVRSLDCYPFACQRGISCYDHTPLAILVFANFKPESNISLMKEQHN